MGEFKDGNENGQGTYYHLADGEWTGDKYVGEFKNGRPNGDGTYYHLAKSEYKGDKYVGRFKDGLRNGQGIYYDSDGTVLAGGTWKNGEFVQ